MYLFGVFVFAAIVSADYTTQSTDLVPSSSNSPNLPDLPVIKYDGTLYQMSPEEIAAMRNATENGEPWSAPHAMPRIEWKPGTLLDLGAGGNGTLSKRDGYHQINLYFTRNCPGDGYVGGAANFGCGGACIFYSLPLTSAYLQQQRARSPYPTASLWPNRACSGTNYQSIGISG